MQRRTSYKNKVLGLAVIATLLAGGTTFAATSTNTVTGSNDPNDPYSGISVNQNSTGSLSHQVNGIQATGQKTLDIYLDKGATISVTNDGSDSTRTNTQGILSYFGCDVNLHNAVNIDVKSTSANTSKDPLYTRGVVGTMGSFSLADGSSINVTADDKRTVASSSEDGAYGAALSGAKCVGNLGNDLSINVTSNVEGADRDAYVKGVIVTMGKVVAGDNTNINITNNNKTNGISEVAGIEATSSGTADFGKNTQITLNVNSNDIANVKAVSAQKSSNVNIGGLKVKMNIHGDDKAIRTDIAALSASGGSTINVNQGSSNDVQLEGDIINDGSTINANFNTASSYFKGNTEQKANGGNINLNLSNGATWDPVFDNRYGELSDSANGDYKPANATTDSVTENGNININGGIVDLTWDNPTRAGSYRTLNFDKITGSNGIFVVDTDLAKNKGDKIVLGAGSDLTSAKVDVKYDPYLANNALLPGTQVKGNSVIFAGAGVGNLKYVTGMEDTYNLYDYTPNVTRNSDGTWSVTGLTIDKGEGSSRAVRMAGENGLSLNQLWLAETNNMQERMGELRGTKPAKAGIWARWHNGKIEQGDTSTQYNIFQGGLDKESNGAHERTYRGFAVSHGTGSSDLELGSGDLSETTLSLYQTGIRNNGFYYDVIAKAGKYANDYDLTQSANRSGGDYSTWAYGISGEVGLRKNLGHGVYVEPQAELILGHIAGADYTTKTGMDVSLNAQNRAITRLGAQIGKEFKGGDIYARASYYHDFGGGLNMDLAAGGETATYSPDMVKNWGTLSIGGNVKAGKNCNVYGEVSKYVGQLGGRPSVNLGVRWTF
jgi:outer membrane autotransporter protein